MGTIQGSMSKLKCVITEDGEADTLPVIIKSAVYTKW
jgi:hypothetical protein